jgi:hypothetical protein
VKNIKVTANETGYLKYVKNWKLENIEIITPKGEAITVENSDKVDLKNVSVIKSNQ